jgi:phospholipid/cholesterol/gamma-HCH transport system substrate-binding protein
MNNSNKNRNTIVGIFVALGLTFLLAGILLVGNLHETFKRKIELVPIFKDVNGLKTGSNIWFSGVKIGTISKIKFDGSNSVAVHLKIETKIEQYVRKNATVKISTDGLIGNKIMLIVGGTKEYPEVEDGDTLLIEKTFSSDDMINILQANNVNLLAITTDFKTISNKMAKGEGSIGKIINDQALYNQIQATSLSLQNAAAMAQNTMQSLQKFSSGLNQKGTLAHELTTDTIVFNSLKNTILKMQVLADTANLFIANLNEASINPNSPIGILLHNKESGAQIKESIKNLESSSKKLDQDLEAVQHSFLLKGYFKKAKKTKKEKK